MIRRSGEFLRASESFSRLVQLPRSKLIGEVRFFELLTEEAGVNFWEKILPLYGEIRLPTEGATQGHYPSILTSLVLKRGDPAIATMAEHLVCSIVASVRHDHFGLPILIAITLIPIGNLGSSPVQQGS